MDLTFSVIVIERLGRRYILLRTLPVVILAWIIVAIEMTLTTFEGSATSGKLASFAGLLLFFLSFAFGVSSTPWAINAVIYPLHVIGTANSLVMTVNWVANLAVASVFLEITGTMVGAISTYLALAFFVLLALVFVCTMVPDTAEKEIGDILDEILGPNYRE